MRFTVVILSALLLSFSCGESKKMKSKSENTSSKVMLSSIGERPREISPTTIKSAIIEGNTLILDVAYSGGCENQSFELIGDEMIMKSLPPKRGVALVRNTNGDTCRELVNKTLRFDITSLAYQDKDGSKIILLLNGYEKQLEYTLVKS